MANIPVMFCIPGNFSHNEAVSAVAQHLLKHDPTEGTIIDSAYFIRAEDKGDWSPGTPEGLVIFPDEMTWDQHCDSAVALVAAGNGEPKFRLVKIK